MCSGGIPVEVVGGESVVEGVGLLSIVDEAGGNHIGVVSISLEGLTDAALRGLAVGREALNAEDGVLRVCGELVRAPVATRVVGGEGGRHCVCQIDSSCLNCCTCPYPLRLDS